MFRVYVGLKNWSCQTVRVIHVIRCSNLRVQENYFLQNRGEMVSIINSVDTGHEDMIHDAEVDYYGLRLATCSSDNSVKVYDIKNGASTLLDDLKGHFGPVWQIAWSHPKFGNLLASCSYDRKVIIWKESNRKWGKYYEYSNHDSSVNSVQFAPAELGLILACGMYNTQLLYYCL